eukprot:2188223-Heterocapsa_arctica.AAC.1
MALESCIKDAGAIWTNQTRKIIMTKCILALGYLYQTDSCHELKGYHGAGGVAGEDHQGTGQRIDDREQEGGREN